MKNVLPSLVFVCIILINNTLYGQKNILLGNGQIFLQAWEYADFIENKTHKIEAYTFSIDEKGSLQKDSILLYRQEINPDSLLIFGTTCDIAFTSTGYFYYETDDIKQYHNTDGTIHKLFVSNRKSQHRPPSPTTKVKSEVVFFYNVQGLLTKEENTTHTYDYWIHTYKKKTDTTLSSLSSLKTIREYTYTVTGKPLEKYISKDSTRYVYPENKSPYCDYCYPKYTNVKSEYDGFGNLIGRQSYTQSGNLYEKRHYYYNTANRINKEVDSTGWAYTTPFLKETILYEYADTTLSSITHIYDTNRKSTTYYTEKRQAIQTNFYERDSLTASQTFRYESGKMVSQRFEYTKSLPGFSSEHTYAYYPNGLLFEEKVIRDEKLVGFIRYHYYP